MQLKIRIRHRPNELLIALIIAVISANSTMARQTSQGKQDKNQTVNSISFDSRAILINGERQLLISGEMHYARSPRELWPQLLDRSVNMGLNCVASYIFWGFHEPQKDVYDFSGQRDIGYFLKLCKERNLKVILRMGPYCCAEWNYGGYPSYLRDEPGITIRTYNTPYLIRVEKYFEHLAAELRPYLATNGGPVILIQVENEYESVAQRYGKEGKRYLKWVVELAARLQLNVQTITCAGGAPGAIECVNGHSISLEGITYHQSKYPDQPLIWTELWPAWYDTWGYQHHLRDARNIAFNVLNFLGNGGSGWNYYMWHGGTNFGRTSMYLQTTSYDFDAPLDEYGRPTLKGLYLARLHKAVKANSKIFLNSERIQKNLSSGIKKTTWSNGKELLTVFVNETDHLCTEDNLTLLPRSARLFDSEGKLLFDSQSDYQATQSAIKLHEWESPVALQNWMIWNEPMPSARIDDFVKNLQPVEQLSLTHDQTDYCWYSNSFTTTAKGQQKIDITYGGDFFYIYLDGKLLTQSQPPFSENRGLTMPEDADHPYVFANALEKLNLRGFQHSFILKDVLMGKHRLDILATALGLVKGDWQISGSMNTERKGIWQDVLVNNKVITNWEMRPFLLGEQLNIPAQLKSVNWIKPIKPNPCTWFNTSFQLTQAVLQSDADYRIDASGLGKGMLFMNGHMLGRYWLIEGNGYGPDESWQNLAREGLSLAPAGLPTQRYYHVPKAWLKENNQLIIFEEQLNLPAKVKLQIRTMN
ncbi:MAG: beta-galactosidase [Bacteroidia bacterium]|nr:beta-galactosidase [Bacteroidia bacterium]